MDMQPKADLIPPPPPPPLVAQAMDDEDRPSKMQMLKQLRAIGLGLHEALQVIAQRDE